MRATKPAGVARRKAACTVLGAALLALAPVAIAQTAWPSKPITMIVPFPPGGVVDTVARPVAEVIGKEIKQTVVVEIRSGAGGATGNDAAARAAADGYAVPMSLSSISVLPEADAVLGRKPAYTLDQLRPIARFTADPVVPVVRADAPWTTLAGFVADLKRRPGATNCGSSGNYGTMHVPMEMLKFAAGFSMVHIPYTGAGPAVLALLGGQVDALATGPSTIARHVKGGKLRALARRGDKPLQALPGVPSLRQAGYPVQFAHWSVLFVPAATPEPIVQSLRAAAKKAAADPQVIATIGKAGSPVEYLDAPEFQTYWDADAKAMVEAMRRIGKVERADRIAVHDDHPSRGRESTMELGGARNSRVGHGVRVTSGIGRVGPGASTCIRSTPPRSRPWLSDFAQAPCAAYPQSLWR